MGDYRQIDQGQNQPEYFQGRLLHTAPQYKTVDKCQGEQDESCGVKAFPLIIGQADFLVKAGKNHRPAEDEECTHAHQFEKTERRPLALQSLGDDDGGRMGNHFENLWQDGVVLTDLHPGAPKYAI